MITPKEVAARFPFIAKLRDLNKKDPSGRSAAAWKASLTDVEKELLQAEQTNLLQLFADGRGDADTILKNIS